MLYSSDRQLHPGDLAFDRAPARLRTVLGSCVALTVWQPRLKLGGMCHYLLPEDNGNTRLKPNHYGSKALDALLSHMQSYAPPESFTLSLFGGAHILPEHEREAIGDLNIAFAKQWIQQNGFKLKLEKTGGRLSRTVILDLSDGAIYLKETSPDEESP